MADAAVQYFKGTEDGEVPTDSESSELPEVHVSNRHEAKKKRRSRYDILDDKWSAKFGTVNNEMGKLSNKLDSILSALTSHTQTQDSENVSPVVSKRHNQTELVKAANLKTHSKDSDVDEDTLSIMAKGSISDDSDSDVDCAQRRLPRQNSDMSNDNLSEDTKKCLFDIFGEDAVVKKTVKKQGISIDKSQQEVLDSSLHCDTPNFLSAFSEENFDLFPVDEDTEKFLQVPSLDTLIEGCLVKRHGSKALFTKQGKAKSLCNQPYKMIEKIAYKGQQASRFGIVIQLYIQQSLGNLLENLQMDTENFDKNKCISSVKDIFAMSTKGLDQLGRTAALHHVVRRTVSMTDSGLFELEDASQFTSLPLTSEGVFGNGLEALLKSRKEKKKQLDELVPDLRKRELKRKMPASRPYDNKRRYVLERPQSSQSTVMDNSYSNFAVPAVPRETNRDSHQEHRGRSRSRGSFRSGSSRGRFGRFSRQ